MNFGKIAREILVKGNREKDTTASSSVYDWINLRQLQLCEEYPFWFLDVIPGAVTAAPTFPYTTNSGWFYNGWLAIRAGVTEYPVKYSMAPDILSPVYSGVAIQKIGWAKLYEADTELTFTKDIRVGAESDFFSVDPYLDTGPPGMIVFYDKVSDYSYLRVKPVPDDNYVLAMKFTLKAFPDLVNTSDSNYLTINYPQILIDGGLAELYAYLGEMRGINTYEAKWTNRLLSLVNHMKNKILAESEVLEPHKDVNYQGTNLDAYGRG